MQTFLANGLLVRSDMALIPTILGESPILSVQSFTATGSIIGISENFQTDSAKEHIESLKEALEKNQMEVIFLDILDVDNPHNNAIFFSNTFKNLRMEYLIDGNSEMKVIEGTLGDIVKKICEERGVDPYYIAEEENGNILSIIRKC